MRILTALLALVALPAFAQTPPAAARIDAYTGLHRAAHDADAVAIRSLIAGGADTEETDPDGRTPLIVAAFASQDGAFAALAEGGADVNAQDPVGYDAVTIAAVADDPDLMSLALSLGNRPGNIHTNWNGTALIAAAHLGHAEVVRRLIAAGSPLDHVNNLGWTALIEAVVLGDGGPDHQATVRALVDAGADAGIADRDGRTPLQLAEDRGYDAIAVIIRSGGG
jgi:uncharacterized protein